MHDPFQAKVESGQLSKNYDDETVHWVQGTIANQNTVLKLIGDDNTKQTGFARAVYSLATDENGEHRFKGKMEWKEFIEKLKDHRWAREYGALIVAGSQDEADANKGLDSDMQENSKFESEVIEHVKNSQERRAA